jgi:hypothetical protein
MVLLASVFLNREGEKTGVPILLYGCVSLHRHGNLQYMPVSPLDQFIDAYAKLAKGKGGFKNKPDLKRLHYYSPGAIGWITLINIFKFW